MSEPILYGLRNVATKEVLVLAYRRREMADDAALRKSNRWATYEVVPLVLDEPRPHPHDWHYNYLRQEIEMRGGVLDPEDGSVSWPDDLPIQKGER